MKTTRISTSSPQFRFPKFTSWRKPIARYQLCCGSLSSPPHDSPPSNPIISPPACEPESTISLPEELVSDILIHVWGDYGSILLVDQQIFALPLNISTYRTTETALIHAPSLCNYALVSRSWATAASPLLYSCVISPSQRHAQLFSRTLQLYPFRAQIVKSISFFVLTSSHSKPRSSRWNLDYGPPNDPTLWMLILSPFYAR